jgi:hypothetical protein
MRTIKKDHAPSEAVTSEALSESLSEYLQSQAGPLSFKKFLLEKSNPGGIAHAELKAT